MVIHIYVNVINGKLYILMVIHNVKYYMETHIIHTCTQYVHT